jgi:hypothetical protein
VTWADGLTIDLSPEVARTTPEAEEAALDGVHVVGDLAALLRPAAYDAERIGPT